MVGGATSVVMSYGGLGAKEGTSVAVNAFMLIAFDKHLDFGRWDWKLLTWTFGVPFVGATVAGAAGTLGPNGVL